MPHARGKGKGKKVAPLSTAPPPKKKKDVVVSVGLHLEGLTNKMEETRFKKRHMELIKKLSKETHFTYNEIEGLLLIYEKFRKENKKKCKGMIDPQFVEVMHNGLDMTDTMLRNYIVSAVRITNKRIPRVFTMESWVKALSLFLRGTLEEKIQYCFKVYDPMGFGYISKDNITNYMLTWVSAEEDAEEAVKDLQEIFTKKIDVDRDAKVSFLDYKQTVLKQPLLLECFGQCLPTENSVITFLKSFTCAKYEGK